MATLPGGCGGIGGSLAVNPRLGASELRLIRRAILNRWPVAAHLRAEVIRVCEDLLRSDDERVRAAAMKTVVEANRQNINIDIEEDRYDHVAAGGVTERREEHRTIKVTFDQGG